MIDGREVGEYVALDQLGTVVSYTSDYVNNVDGTRCSAEAMVTLSSAFAGSIVGKWEEVVLTPFLGFDVPAGPAWYQLIFYNNEEMQTDCNNPDAEGLTSTIEPIIGRSPIDPEGGISDPEMRMLSEDGLAMTGSYQAHALVGDDIFDMTVEWDLTWASEAP